MNLDADITKEELEVFLQETDEQIELLDEDIIRLEKEKKNPDLMQEIFRAAHTIKGSSGMLGHQRMAELTHAMESLLDRLRNGELEVSTEIINALLHSLDALKELREEIVTLEDSDIDIAPIVARLKDAAKEGVTPTQEKEAVLTLSEDARERLDIALAKGQNIYQIAVFINRGSDWAAVRCQQILNEVAQKGEVIDSAPSAKEIEEARVGFDLKLILSSLEDEDTIQGAINSIAEIDRVEVIPYDSRAGTATGEKSTTTQQIASEQSRQAMGKSPKKITGAASPKKSQAIQSVRVDVKLLDNLMNMVGELVIDRSKISRVSKLLKSKYEDDEMIDGLRQTSDHIIKIINELQEKIMQVRMVPLGTIFNRFPRMVRDLAQKENKKLDFTIKGEETELDRSIIELVRDPLIHLLRNAVDHGVETPEERKSAHRPEVTMVQLLAYHEQSHIVIIVEDDGKGIDVNKVKDAAVKKSLISAEAAGKLTDLEAIDLIFMAGMSTVEKATEVSGRGVGLDIVKNNIEGLGGSVSLVTKVGQGSKFTIRLPLTVAIIQGLLVSSDGVTYVIPIVSVAETLKVEQSEVQTIGGREIIRARDRIIPLLRLNTALGNGKMEAKSSDETLIVVVKSGEKLVGTVVDVLMEQQEIVVKPLGECLGEIEGIAGATILGDGQVALILDVDSLVKMSMQKSSGNRRRELRAVNTKKLAAIR